MLFLEIFGVLCLSILGVVVWNVFWKILLANDYKILEIILLIILVTALNSYILSGCRSKPNSVVKVAPTTIYADTTRVKLRHRAEQSADTLIIVHQRTQNSVTHYEKSVQHYDSIQVVLP